MAVFRNLCIVLAVLVNATFASGMTEIEKQGQQRQKMIEALEAKSRNGIIEFTQDQFDELVFKNPRPYDVVLLWNVKPGKCDHCQEAQDEYDSLVYSFINARGAQNTEGNAQKEKKIFFGITSNQKLTHCI